VHYLERRNTIELEYEVNVEKTMWLPKATLDTKLVLKHRVE
jgi:hypothetical protein